mmetsp:Transcript_26025/g.65681  ORF Transcript_26025/g.65681 Transcript_26025/m.65681 type:complete len:162 (+) Transcript_26025:90-575(+)|eukprot:CAMPEP_0173430234 /NCGR_PEP_ID=MMETSP1357-20121228/8728_1 /TAXON_ID=77926 /ORGANISM="Hemiselmis rufescens, Strain PCC563" /LENGTH=161 /DNA_ID=CAMNT_0014394539 /DNA_START=84 /DNA_END=569 /DNA_ORIENTATION=-
MASAPYLSDARNYHKRACVNSFSAGALFGTGWLLFFDSVVHTQLFLADGWDEIAVQAAPLFAASLTLVLLNTGMSEFDALRESLYVVDAQEGLAVRKAWVAFTALSALLSTIASVCLVSRAYLHQGPSETVVAGSGVTSTTLIVLSGLVFWVGRGHGIEAL